MKGSRRVSFGMRPCLYSRVAGWLVLILLAAETVLVVGGIPLRQDVQRLERQNQALLEIIDEQAANLISLKRVIMFEGAYLPPVTIENNVRADILIDIVADENASRRLYDYAAYLRCQLEYRGALVSINNDGKWPEQFMDPRGRRSRYYVAFTDRAGELTLVRVIDVSAQQKNPLVLFEGRFTPAQPVLAKNINQMFTAIATREAYLWYGSGN